MIPNITIDSFTIRRPLFISNKNEYFYQFFCTSYMTYTYVHSVVGDIFYVLTIS